MRHFSSSSLSCFPHFTCPIALVSKLTCRPAQWIKDCVKEAGIVATSAEQVSKICGNSSSDQKAETMQRFGTE